MRELRISPALGSHSRKMGGQIGSASGSTRARGDAVVAHRLLHQFLGCLLGGADDGRCVKAATIAGHDADDANAFARPHMRHSRPPRSRRRSSTSCRRSPAQPGSPAHSGRETAGTRPAHGPAVLNHVLVLGERHLRKILTHYFAYYHQARTHLALDKDAPDLGRQGHHNHEPASSWRGLRPLRTLPYPGRRFDTSRRREPSPTNPRRIGVLQPNRKTSVN